MQFIKKTQFFAVQVTAIPVPVSNGTKSEPKQVHHFLLLRAYAPERIKFLALTRDGRAVAKSMVRGERGDMMRVRVKRRSGKELTSSKALLKSGIAAWRLTILQMAALIGLGVWAMSRLDDLDG